MKLREFLFLNKTVDKEERTHSSISLKTKYNITEEKKNVFYTLYGEALNNEERLSLVEIPQTNYIPLIIDVDLNIDKETFHREEIRFLYDRNHVKSLIFSVNKILTDHLQEDDYQSTDNLFCCLLERNAYLKNDKVKNGFHLHWPRIFLSRQSIQKVLLPKIIAYMKDNNVDIPRSITYDTMIDHSIYSKGGKPWFLYGSTKVEENTKPYLVTSAYHYNDNNGSLIEEDDWMKSLHDYQLNHSTYNHETPLQWLPEVFSIEPEGNKDQYIRQLVLAEEEEEELILQEEENSSSSLSPIQKYSISLQQNESSFDSYVDQLLDSLSDDYSNDYNNWLLIGFILYNTYQGSDLGFKKWDEFSKRSTQKYDYNVNLQFYNNMKPSSLSIGTLRYICNKNDYVKYKEITEKYNQDSLKMVKLEDANTHNDIAKLLKYLYPDLFVCSSIHSSQWYMFRNHIWMEIEDGHELRKRISSTIYEKFNSLLREIHSEGKEASYKRMEQKQQQIDYVVKKLRTDEDYLQTSIDMFSGKEKDMKMKEIEAFKEQIDTLKNELQVLKSQTNDSPTSNTMSKYKKKDEKENYQEKENKERIDKINKIKLNLKNSMFKSSVMKEAKEFFYNEEFSKKIDRDPYLFGFKNGIYDLKNRCFRDGYPEDYLSKQCPVIYREDFTMESPEVKEIIAFFKKIFPDQDLREYFIYMSSKLFYGKNEEKMFSIWTGTGNNGKSLTQDLFEQLFGDLSVKLPTSLITGSKRTSSSNATPELVRAGSGTRIAFIQEPAHTDSLNTGVLKELSGNDRFYARGLNQSPIDINPMFKVMLVCNKPPAIDNDCDAVWDRVRLIPFLSRFPKEENDVPLTEEERIRQKVFYRDSRLAEKIPEMLEGLAWYLIDRYNFYQENKIRLVEPAVVLRATEIYKDKNDKVQYFLSQRIERDTTDKMISMVDLYDSFKDFFKDEFPTCKVPSGQAFKDSIVKHWGDPTEGTTTRAMKWKGYRFIMMQQT
jgi:P4 family phage/plasmid primase-like protien